MSCGSKRFNIERYEIAANMADPDQIIDRVYNPDTQIPHPPPWPLERTQFDMNMQKTWCPVGCGSGNSFVPFPAPTQAPIYTPNKPGGAYSSYY